MTSPIRIKKTPVVIMKQIIVAQILVTALYQLARIFANYGELYQSFMLSTALSYEVAKFIAQLAVETWLVGYFFLTWYLNEYEVYPDELQIMRGIFFRKRDTVPLTRPVSVSYAYGLLARIFGYGTIIIRNKGSESPIFLQQIPSPRAYGKRILEQNHLRSDADVFKPIDLGQLLGAREHEGLEFKTTFRWDMLEARINKALEKTVMKTVAAFLNGAGGHLVLGVGDKGDVHGLLNDYQSLKRKDADGFENHFNNVFKETIGPEFREFVKLRFQSHDGKEVCVIQVAPSVRPVYAKLDDSEMFYIRTGNATSALQMSQVPAYVRRRFRES